MGRRRASKTGFRSEPTVTPVGVPETRGMLTIGVEHPMWGLAEDPAVGVRAFAQGGELPIGSFVRLQPPASVDAHRARRMAECFRAEGMVVRPMPGASRAHVVAAYDEGCAPELPTHREVVEAMVAEARTEDRDALAAECRRAMDEEGL